MVELRVCFVGAGAVNFGGAVGPWDHSRRLEHLGGLRFVAIVDPLTDKARDVLEQKRSSPYAAMYASCQVFADVATALQQSHFDVAFVGVPPDCHGSFSRDLELQLLKAGVHLFVEKPVSVVTPEEFVLYAEAVERERQSRGLVVSVGYMFRYHPAVLQMRAELEKHGRPITALSARYNCAYPYGTHPFWWDLRRSGGPIVEQATHLCDLIRFLAGDVDLNSVRAVQVPPNNSITHPGYLTSQHPVVREACKDIPPDKQVPRATQAVWRLASGGVGSLSHTIALHGKKYEAAIDIWCDGLRLALDDPYFPECTLRVRRGEDDDQVYTFPVADPYLTEDEVFLKAVRENCTSQIRSSYSNAANTYQFTWAIRRASEEN